MRSQYGDSWPQNSSSWLNWLGRNFPLALFFVFAFAGMVTVYLFFSPSGGEADAIAAAISSSEQLSAPLIKIVPARPVLQRLAQSERPLRIGIIAGHQGFDSGAVCPDGLTEAQVNGAIASKLAAQLQDQGIRSEILDEFDERLNGFSGSALISIHADSCAYINDLATGFKIAGSSQTDSTRLFNCVEQSYQEATHLTYHANTITDDMKDYHAFGRLAPGTPAIIIEVGFLNLDRTLLTTQSDPAITGLTNGVLCFLDR